jgi:hypothetical protein
MTTAIEMNAAYQSLIQSARASNAAMRDRGWTHIPHQVKPEPQEKLDRNQETLQALMQSGQTMTVTDMAEAAGIKKAEAYRAVLRMKTSGFVRMVRMDRHGKHYTIANAARQMPEPVKCDLPPPKEVEGRYTVKIEHYRAAEINGTVNGSTIPKQITLAGPERITQEFR